jgi:hypothetical protein
MLLRRGFKLSGVPRGFLDERCSFEGRCPLLGVWVCAGRRCPVGFVKKRDGLVGSGKAALRGGCFGGARSGVGIDRVAVGIDRYAVVGIDRCVVLVIIQVDR